MWCNRKVKKGIKKRNRNWKQYCITKRDCDYVKYKECRNIVVKELKAARKNLNVNLQQILIKGNPKSFFRYVRSKTKSKERVGPLKDLAGNILDDDSSMCETLNTYFASVFTKEKTDNIPEVKQVFHGGSSRLLSLIDITPDHVF